jgi:DNA helicase-2/ATP-dependent DNA helicase PcrA
MKQRGRYDFNDMILWVRDAMLNDDMFKVMLQERFQWILVDEYQDTNGSQNQLLNLLLDFWDEPNIFVVGDDDQGVYEFQGARLKNITDFVDKYNPEVITLDTNYRSSESIISTANNIIRNNKLRVSNYIGTDKDMVCGVPRTTPDPKVFTIKNIFAEDAFILDFIQTYCKDNNPSELAIIYRKHAQAEELIRQCQMLGIPVNVKRPVNVLEEPIVGLVYSCLKFITGAYWQNDIQSLSYKMFIHPALGINPYLIEQQTQKAVKEKIDIVSFIYANNPDVKLIIDTLNDIKANIPNRSATDTIQHLLYDLKITDYAIKSGKIESLSTFVQWVKQECYRDKEDDIFSIIIKFENMMADNFRLPMIDMNFDVDGVNFLTAHGAKGLEFDTVIIKGATKNIWETSRGDYRNYSLPPTLTKTSEEDSLEAGRRLFYVAASRAENKLCILVPEQDEKGKELTVARFVTETELPVEQAIVPITDYGINLTKPSPKLDINSIRQNILESFVENYRLSVSHMNKYLECPVSFWHEVIVKAPQFSSIQLVIGNAVHFAMKKVYDFAKEEKRFPTLAILLDHYFTYLSNNKGQISKEEYGNAYAWGNKVLPRYYKDVILRSNMYTLNEYSVKDISIEGVPVKFDIDKLEFEGNLVDIIDYKTGKIDNIKKAIVPASDDYIGGDYWRQGLFYYLGVDGIFYQPWKPKGFYIDPIHESGFERIHVPITPEGLAIVKSQI